MTARDLITKALTRLNVIGLGETPTDEDAQDGLDHANLLVDSWALDRMWLHEALTITKALTANTTSYTIGTGAAIDTPRPDFLPEQAGLILDNTLAAASQVEIPIRVFSDDEYRSLTQKTVAGQCRGVYFDFSYDASGFGLVRPWPIPSATGTSLKLYLPAQAVARFATLDTVYLAPRGYERALVYGLARELAPSHAAPISELMLELGREALELVRERNTRISHLRADDVVALARGPNRTEGPLPSSGILGGFPW